MTVLKPRNRVVIFRLTQDEYVTLQSACASQGGRSLSEFARSRLLSAIDSSDAPEGEPEWEKKLAEIHAAVSRLARLMEKS
ncbi:MAG TPA: hypothetical protein VKV15_24090 [Bryobacteraceae bacterium]|nr:hypothetical protein [Bryobacteraceae bacterium]